MRKFLFVLCLLITFPLVIQSQNGKIIKGKIFSSILGVEREYSIYLPAGYDESDKQYPVLYLLHGAWGQHEDWAKQGNVAFIADKTINEGVALPMIVVMPDARGKGENYAGHHMGYFNYSDWKYQDFFVQEFIPTIEKEYRIKSDKQHRAIAGLSMGGGGTMIFAQKYPEYFSSACSLSGSLMILNNIPSVDMDDDFIKEMKNNDPTRFVQSANEEQLAKLKTVRWYADCGDDDYLAKSNVAFFLAMKEKGIPLEYRMRDGAHTWNYWQTGLIPILQYISIGFMK